MCVIAMTEHWLMLQDRGRGADDGDVQCDCALVAVTRTVSKEGPNQGRSFRCCNAQSQAAKCRLCVYGGAERC